MLAQLERIKFGNLAADDASISELQSYFVEQRTFEEFYRKDDPLLISLGKKGIGKSALLKWSAGRVRELYPDDIVVSVRGVDLSTARFPTLKSGPSFNENVNGWMQRIATVINREIAKKIGFAFTDDDISLIETAEIEGFRSRGMVVSILDRLQKTIANKFEIERERIAISNEIEALKRGRRSVWLFLDDMDATFINDPAERMSVGSFFSACRYLFQEKDEIFFRITLRTDVWTLVRESDESLDKVVQYVRHIGWNISDFRTLIYNRLASNNKSYQVNESSEETQAFLIRQYFQKDAPWGNKNIDLYRPIYTLSYHRPRWALNICQMARESACNRNSQIIELIDVDNVLPEYSRERIRDLVAEHKHQCDKIDAVIYAFTNKPTRFTNDELVKLLNIVKANINPTIEGRGSPSSIEIASFLYRIGFIVARKDTSSESYEHFHYEDMKQLLDPRFSAEPNLIWEIHPCYRKALNLRDVAESQRKRRNKY